MLGKAAWFTRRRYSGWGLAPKTWQGWVYILIATGLLALSQNLPVAGLTKSIILAILIFILLLDFLQIMASIKLDERDFKIEAIAERNAAWTMVAGLGATAAYISSTQNQELIALVMPFLIGILLLGFGVKLLSNIWLKNRDL